MQTSTEEIRAIYRLANSVRNRTIAHQNRRLPPVSLTLEDVFGWLCRQSDMSDKNEDVLSNRLLDSLELSEDNSQRVLVVI